MINEWFEGQVSQNIQKGTNSMYEANVLEDFTSVSHFEMSRLKQTFVTYSTLMDGWDKMMKLNKEQRKPWWRSKVPFPTYK